VLRENALFGAELSGHFFYRRLHALDDGMYSFLRCARMAQDAGMPLSALLGAIPTLAATPMLRLPCDEQEGAKLIDAIAAAAEGPYEVSRLDGVRVDAPDGWGLVRMSATEPLICVRFEADAPDRLPGLVDELLAPAPELRDRVAAELGWRGGAKK
jgi:phosphomannomutase/phosphoglucomutase